MAELGDAANSILMAWGSRDPEQLTTPFAAALMLARAYNRGDAPPPEPAPPPKPVDVDEIVRATKRKVLAYVSLMLQQRVDFYLRRDGYQSPLAREAKGCLRALQALGGELE